MAYFQDTKGRFFRGQGGRPKGAKDKRKDLHAMCEKYGVVVFEEMLKCTMDTKEENREQFSRWCKLAEYLYSKPKDTSDIELTPEQIRELIVEWTKNVQPTGS